MISDIDQALAHHQAGRLLQAEAIYRRILKAQPDDADALHLLGVVAHQRGEHEEAAAKITHRITSYNVCYTKLLRLYASA